VTARRVLAAGVLLDVLAVVACLVLPLYAGSDGHATLLEVNGPGALLPLGLFLALGVGAWLAPWRALRVVLVGGHALLTVLALLTVGAFFLPATAALVIGAALPHLRPAATHPAGG
jgi:hypothetical protein